MSIIRQDEYRRGWCLRYLREAKADLRIAENARDPSLAVNMGLTAARKAQTALYYALGDPMWIDPLVRAKVETVNLTTKDPMLRCLLSIERSLRSLSTLMKSMEEKEVLRRVKAIIEVSETLISLYIW
ncbi:MAG: hypothetical protein QXI39_02640 [Candidatus Bathyarchaeia archaeon]